MSEFDTLESILENYDKPEELKEAATCAHSSVTEGARGFCRECGVEVHSKVSMEREWRYFGDQGQKNPNRVLARKENVRTIYADVEHLGFADNVVHLANQIFIELCGNQIYRGNPRKSLVFAVIFHAHKILGKAQSLHRLSQIFNVGRKISNRGLDFTNLNRKRSPILASNVFYITPDCFVDEILDFYKGTNEQRQEVLKICKSLKNKSSKLNRAKPFSVAAGIVFYWMSQSNINVKLKDYSAKCGLSELTINRIVREINNVV